MYQNYNYYPSQQSQNQPNYQIPYSRQAPPQMGLKGRLVSSWEEARAASIDFDGSVFYFPDLANKRIYTKQINMDGTATLCEYELVEKPISKENTNETLPSLDKFVTREEFEQVLAQLREKLATPASQKSKTEVLSF